MILLILMGETQERESWMCSVQPLGISNADVDDRDQHNDPELKQLTLACLEMGVTLHMVNENLREKVLELEMELARV